ncbi:MAG: hypothetical protein KA778_00090 [Burkholderiaceae bacterium]|jgi:DNA repair exonuclease SbcCD ATPase subunit|nr:hypothetical protein [Burkholderiaceae bacterium]MBP6707550.1 hypothetical protein [Accumulibacter sp.]MBP6813251.1 hypothetical protein [Burkholderiaceae bacterium]MBP7658373.1 hypothetical protein [Burkholderiaceae bacterium]
MCKRLALVPLGIAALLSACTYIEERRDLNAGGPQQRETAAQAALDAERQRAGGLSARQAQRQDELAALNMRLSEAQAGLDAQTKRLDEALRNKKISITRYNELKRQADGLKSDAAGLKLRNDADRASKANLGNDPAKLKQLEALEQRRRDLESALQAAVR